ncbi:hypothetical protein ACFQV2_21065 [Actinokineospora soli]|uniref:Uncharacterized protein n=1 Tax=Actinokineospora soli TaxID=1048753 RepID=A0ABW2TQK4_9PSEU
MVVGRCGSRRRCGRSWSAPGGTGSPFADDECGKWYGRSLWSLLTAAQGFTYDGPAKWLAFRQVHQGALGDGDRRGRPQVTVAFGSTMVLTQGQALRVSTRSGTA